MTTPDKNTDRPRKVEDALPLARDIITEEERLKLKQVAMEIARRLTDPAAFDSAPFVAFDDVPIDVWLILSPIFAGIGMNAKVEFVGRYENGQFTWTYGQRT